MLRAYGTEKENEPSYASLWMFCVSSLMMRTGSPGSLRSRRLFISPARVLLPEQGNPLMVMRDILLLYPGVLCCDMLCYGVGQTKRESRGRGQSSSSSFLLLLGCSPPHPHIHHHISTNQLPNMLVQRSSTIAMSASRRSCTSLARQVVVQAPRRLQSTEAGTATSSYTSILVDTVGKNKDVSLITLNRPKAVCLAAFCLRIAVPTVFDTNLRPAFTCCRPA